MDYVGLDIRCDATLSEILIAELSELSFSTFEETPQGIKAYIEKPDFDSVEANEVLSQYKEIQSYEITEIPGQNWNAVWEQNYQPVVINDRIIIRAPFHEKASEDLVDIVIHPKMSFGTGHHETTSLMLDYLLNMDHKGKIFVDFGAGTGILGILAGKLGAEKIIATDIDEVCIESAIENFKENEIANFRVIKGPAEYTVKEVEEEADIVCANINKNTLLKELAFYVRSLASDGTLLLSGFYTADDHELITRAQSLGLKNVHSSHKNNWSILVFRYASL